LVFTKQQQQQQQENKSHGYSSASFPCSGAEQQQENVKTKGKDWLCYCCAG
jgi:hypothetical protein